MVKSLLISLSLFIGQGRVYAQNTSFCKEHLTFKIENGYFHVTGEYMLRSTNDSTGRISLFYPFPTDSVFAPVDSLFIFDTGRNNEIPVLKQSASGAFFIIPLDSVTTVLISYRQKLLSCEARYILTSTRHWEKPLEEAIYELITPADMKIRYFSYTPDNGQKFDKQVIYYWRKTDFMPERDMVFMFEE
jgi:hypothetical protein